MDKGVLIAFLDLCQVPFCFGLDKHFFECKIVNIFHLIETVLLSTHNIGFGCEIRKKLRTLN